MLSGRPSINTIYLRIKADFESRLTGNRKIPKLSFYGILSIVFAGAIHLCYGLLYKFLDQMFYDTAELEYLKKIAFRRGIIPKSATFSTGVITVFGSEGIEITEDFIFRDSEGNEYSPDEVYTIPSSGEINITVISNTEGEFGNTSDSSLILDLDSLENAQPEDLESSCPIVSGLDNGVDEEDLISLRNRVAISYSVPPAGGRTSDYKLWALEIPGISYAWVKPTAFGSGTVGVVLADTNGLPPTLFALQNARNNISSKMPAGIITIVESVIRRKLDIELAISPNNVEVRANIRDYLDSLFQGLSIPGETFYLNSIRTAIGQTGVSNYSILKFYIDEEEIPVDDIEIPNYREYLYLGDVSFTNL